MLLEEEGSQLADELWARSSQRVASRLVYAEARAALAAAHRGGRIDQNSLRAAVGNLEAACGAMLLIGVDWPLAQHAGELAERHALRGYDAVHLATALATSAPDLALVTWDRDLASAALELGITIIPSRG
ncbi:MAG TPA: type II toxin-antitoxin system VapC family toxin [Solirubrobacteraceae bacterium]|nr:type II toxin-antitoxin system VapC family toxin [Solirubrobacteraceae bacterium]